MSFVKSYETDEHGFLLLTARCIQCSSGSPFYGILCDCNRRDVIIVSLKLYLLMELTTFILRESREYATHSVYRLCL